MRFVFFLTIGDLNLCSLGPTPLSMVLHHQSIHSVPTYQSSKAWATIQRSERQESTDFNEDDKTLPEYP